MPHEARATSRPEVLSEERATTWDAISAAALRVAPREPLDFAVRPSQTRGGHAPLRAYTRDLAARWGTLAPLAGALASETLAFAEGRLLTIHPEIGSQ